MSGPFGGARLDLELRSGSRFYQEIGYTDSAGAAPDLTGYTAQLDIRARTDVSPATAGTPIFQFRTTPTGSQGTITLGSTTTETMPDGSTATIRLITLDASASLTDALAPTTGGNEHAYDLELVSGTGAVDVLCSGYVTIRPAVTR